MRTATQEQAIYNGITPATFGARVGGEKPLSVQTVLRMIKARRIRPDLVTNCGTEKRPNYRIHPDAVRLFHADHSVAKADAA